MTISQEWSGYIDDIDDGIVYLRLIDETDPEHPEEYGESPIENFSHFGDRLQRGVFIRMYIVEDDDDLHIEWIVPSDEDIAEGKRQARELARMMDVFKDDP
jgi:hypothetical protein